MHRVVLTKRTVTALNSDVSSQDDSSDVSDLDKFEEAYTDFWKLLGDVIIFFFCCIAELAIKPCRSSRSKLRGEFGIPKHLQNRKQKHNKATNTPNPKHNTKQKEHGKCLECETRGEKRVKRPKRPNALICRTPGGSIRYPLSCSLGMMLISHSIVSIPASPSRFAI